MFIQRNSFSFLAFRAQLQPADSCSYLSVMVCSSWTRISLANSARGLISGIRRICSSAGSHQVTPASRSRHCWCRSDPTHKIQRIPRLLPDKSCQHREDLGAFTSPGQPVPAPGTLGYVFSSLWKRAGILFLDPTAGISIPPPKLHQSKDCSHTRGVVLGNRQKCPEMKEKPLI